MNYKKTYLSVGLGLLLFAQPVFAHKTLVKTAENGSQPENIADLTADLIRYHDSGKYQKDFDQVVHQAQLYLKKQADPTKRQAIILDVDETILSQWKEIKANQFAYFDSGACHLPKGPCGDSGWIKKEAASAFSSVRDLIEQARKLGVAVFLVTGRSEKYRNHTIRNLHKEKITGWSGLYMRPIGDNRPAAAYKTPVRERIEKQGYHIILNMGDQQSDLDGGFGGKTFLLPNPFYKVP